MKKCGKKRKRVAGEMLWGNLYKTSRHFSV